jgi:hypothetical protein
MYIANTKQLTDIGICSRSPITEALCSIDSGPNSLMAVLMKGFRAFTLRICAHEQMNTKTQDNSPSNVDKFVIADVMNLSMRWFVHK